MKGNYVKGQTFVERERIPTGMKNSTANALGDLDMYNTRLLEAYHAHGKNVKDLHGSILGMRTSKKGGNY